ncbi:MAG TPA: NADH-quinone oxidoreductase subunit NuoK [Candidatus Acidoferrum sp.]|jgi:NADH-quinone oxidoreductase subunit K
MVPLSDYLFLSFTLVIIGTLGFFNRSNLLVKLFSIELILNAASINLAVFARLFADAAGQLFSVFTMAIMAAEIIVGMGILAAVFRRLRPTPPTALERAAIAAEWR